MTANRRRILSISAILAVILFFQNCGTNQNFDLEQASQRLSETSGHGAGEFPSTEPTSSSGGSPGEQAAAEPAPTPTPQPTPTPDPTDYSSKGQYCLRKDSSMPKFRVSLADLRGAINDPAPNLNSYYGPEYRLRDLNLYLSSLDMRSVPISSAYNLAGIDPILRSDRSELNADFALLFESHLQLGGAAPGYYQLGMVASGQVELQIQSVDGAYRTVLQNLSGLNETRFHCSEKAIRLLPGDQLGFRIRQVHGQAPRISNVLYWRKVSDESAAGAINCGVVGEYFDDHGNATSLLNSTLAKGWTVPGSAQLTMIADGPNLVQNPGFEDVTGLTLPSGSGWYKILPRNGVPFWLSYDKMELQNAGESDLSPARGGQYWIELDAEKGDDAVLQQVSVKKNKSYRYLFDFEWCIKRGLDSVEISGA